MFGLVFDGYESACLMVVVTVIVILLRFASDELTV